MRIRIQTYPDTRVIFATDDGTVASLPAHWFDQPDPTFTDYDVPALESITLADGITPAAPTDTPGATR